MSDDVPPPAPRPLPAPSKLTTSKQRWAGEGRFLTGHTARPQAEGLPTEHQVERLPPGQHLVRDWPVLDLGVHPRITLERWTLRVDGAVEEPLLWNWAAFQAQPRHREVSDIHCVTTWSRYDNTWEGVATRELLAAARPTPEARFVVLHSHDGYTTNLPLRDFAAANAMLASSWQGTPLTPEHGGPVRLVVPHLYLWKSAKWLQRIEFRADDQPGYWEVRGYHERGDPWREQRYSDDS